MTGGYYPQPPVAGPPAQGYGWPPAGAMPPGPPPPGVGYGYPPAGAIPPGPPPPPVDYGGWYAGAPPAPAPPVTAAPQPVPVAGPNPAAEALLAHPLGVAGWYELDSGRLVYGVPWLFELPAPDSPPTSTPGSGQPA